MTINNEVKKALVKLAFEKKVEVIMVFRLIASSSLLKFRVKILHWDNDYVEFRCLDVPENNVFTLKYQAIVGIHFGEELPQIGLPFA